MTSSGKLFLLALITATIYLTGCNKTSTTPATIVGTWGIASQENKLYVNGVVKYDTTVLAVPGQTALTFTADGYYLELTGHNQYGGAYTYTSGVVSLFDTSYGNNKWVPYTVSTLTDNKLSLLVYKDTISLSPIDSIGWVIANFTR